MKNFEFCVPTKIFFGKGAHLKVGEIIKNYGYKKVLFHYGKGSIKKSGLYQQIIDSLQESNVDFVELGGVEPNPKVNLIREAAELCKSENCDMILAVGGGSVIDSAKLTAIAALTDKEPWDFSMKKEVASAALPIGVVLTISAAGSETSSSVVITNEDGLLKRGFNCELIRPLFSVLNPELTYSVNSYQTACGITDIMMHTIERYFMDNEPTELTDRLCEGLLQSVIDAGKAVTENPFDYEARATLMWGGSLSHNDLMGLGRAFFMNCHQIEHELSGMYDFVAHGAGLAVIFPAWAKYVYKYNVDRFCKYAVRVWNIGMDSENPEKTALEGIAATEEYFKSIGMPVSLSEFNIQDINIEEMAEKCTFWGARTLPSPIALGKKEIIDIFELAR